MAQNRKFQNFLDGVMPKVSDGGGSSGAIPRIYRLTTAADATNSVSVTVDTNFEVSDVWCMLLADGGANGNAFQVLNDSTAITDSIVVGTAGDKDVVRCGEIDNAGYKIAAGGTLKATATDAGSTDIPSLHIFVLGYTYS